jgi:hypothetical protein
MARRDIPMNEVVETIYQWHQGRKILQISKSLGLDRKTVRKYLGRVNELSIDRDTELVGITRMAVYYLERGVRTPSKTLVILMECINQKEAERRKEKKHGKKNARTL